MKRRNDEKIIQEAAADEATVQPASPSMPPSWWEEASGAEGPRFPNTLETMD